jgi:hypothetical protein
VISRYAGSSRAPAIPRQVTRPPPVPTHRHTPTPRTDMLLPPVVRRVGTGSARSRWRAGTEVLDPVARRYGKCSTRRRAGTGSRPCQRPLVLAPSAHLTRQLHRPRIPGTGVAPAPAPAPAPAQRERAGRRRRQIRLAIRRSVRRPVIKPRAATARDCAASQVLPVQFDRTPPKRSTSGRLYARQSGHLLGTGRVVHMVTTRPTKERHTAENSPPMPGEPSKYMPRVPHPS